MSDQTPSDGGVDGDEVLELLQDLVRIRSPYFHESEISEFVYNWFTEAGLDPEYQVVTDERVPGYEGRNVIVRLKGSDPAAPTLLLNGHMDTVEVVDDWEEDPLSGAYRDGKVIGQGAADMKGGLAASMVATRELAQADLRGDLVFAAVVDEEGPYGLGTNQLIRDGITSECDTAIVTEPGPVLARDEMSNPSLLLGARGRVLYEFIVNGTAAHGSQPHFGTNAVSDAARLTRALEGMDLGHHETVGSGSICPLSIEGGDNTLSVPDRCRVLVDRHVVPGETVSSAITEVEHVLEELDLDSEIEVNLPQARNGAFLYGPYVTNPDNPLVRSLENGVRAMTGEDPAIGYSASIGDFNFLGNDCGLPTVIVGPDGGNIHGAGEFVSLEDVKETASTLIVGCEHYLG